MTASPSTTNEPPAKFELRRLGDDASTVDVEMCSEGCGRPSRRVGFGSHWWTLSRCEICANDIDEVGPTERAATEVGWLSDPVARLAKDAGRHYAACTFASFPTRGDVRRAAARDKVERWVAELEKTVQTDPATGKPTVHGPNLFLHGPQGEGKTGLAVAAAMRLADRGVGARLFTTVDWLLAVNAAQFDDEQKLRPYALVEEIARATPVLVLDELAGNFTDYRLEHLLELVSYRCREERPTIVTSNYAPSKLISSLARNESPAAAAIVSRLSGEGATKVAFEFGDLRLPETVAA